MPHPSYLKKHRKRILKILGISILILSLTIIIIINYSVYHLASPAPSNIPQGAREIQDAPEKFGIKLKSIICLNNKVPTIVAEPSSNKPITKKALLIRKQLSDLGYKTPNYGTIKGTVVILHGRNGRKENSLSIAERFCAVGIRCILIDLPSHGDSPVDNVKFGSTEWEQDIPYKVLTECAEIFQFNKQPAALWGMSMGGSFATAAAADPIHGKTWSSITIVCSFDALNTVIKKKCKTDWLTNLASTLCQVHGGANFSKVNPATWAENVNTPVLVAHGDKDELIPISNGKKLYQSFASNDKKWLTVEGGNHNNILITPMPLYAEMAHWILTHLN